MGPEETKCSHGADQSGRQYLPGQRRILNIHEFFDEIGYAPKGFDSSYNTMNGWALEQLEHIPQVGESFTYAGLTVTVKEMDDQRVTKLLVKREIAEPMEEE